MTVNGSPGSYNIEGLEEGSMYRITVLGVANGSSIPSNTITAMTEEKGESESYTAYASSQVLTIHTATVLKIVLGFC